MPGQTLLWQTLLVGTILFDFIIFVPVFHCYSNTLLLTVKYT